MECFMSRKQWSEIVRAAAISELIGKDKRKNAIQRL